MGVGSAFRVPISLVKNGISFKITSLPDSGAHGFCFLNTRIAQRASQLTGNAPLRLKHPITPKGYDGVHGKVITHFVVYTIKIDGYTLPEIPFLILDLGNQDAILGNGWLAHFDVLPDLKNKKLFWRTPPPYRPSFTRQIQVASKSSSERINRSHQLDVEHRQRLFTNQERREADGRLASIRQILP
jgi:hypothetical protein